MEECSEERDEILHLQHKYTEICNSLNIESNVAKEAWRDFCRINGNVTLEVTF